MEPAEFKNQVWALMRDITDRMNGVFHPIIDRYGLTIMQMRVLFEIRREDGCTVSGLSRRVCAAGPTSPRSASGSNARACLNAPATRGTSGWCTSR